MCRRLRLLFCVEDEEESDFDLITGGGNGGDATDSSIEPLDETEGDREGNSFDESIKPGVTELPFVIACKCK